jgi:D-alanyl-D-alanine carboxypeptidase
MKYLLLSFFLFCLAPAAAAGIPVEFIDSYAREHRFSGTVLVQEQGKVTYRKSFGLASIAFKAPNTPDTLYKAASITKAFTAVLVLQQVEQGRLDLARPIASYLPDYRGNGAGKVSLHQLLNHTSGLPNFDQVKDLETALTQGVPTHQVPATSDQLLSRHCSGALVAEPGTVFDYNNCDYIVLGKILERVSGKSYEQLLREQILQPLKLEHTGMMRQSRILEGLADTYMYREDLKSLANDLPVYSENLYAAGSLYASADDVLAFANALFGGKLLKPASAERMFKPGLDEYGYGVWSYEMSINGRKERIVKRPGRVMGAQTQLFRMRDADITIVVLANTDAVDLDQMVADLARAAR